MASLIAVAALVAVIQTATPAAATPVEAAAARMVAEAWLAPAATGGAAIAWQEEIVAGGRVVAHVFGFEPAGYVVVSADTDLPPVVAHATVAACPHEGLADSPLARLVAADLASRIEARALVAPSVTAAHHTQWEQLLAGSRPVSAVRFEQWPPAGTTPTGGWLAGNWTQSAPYNALCPLDVAHGSARSLAGCPSVAMAMILDHRRTLVGTKLDGGDRYWHAYAGNYFWVPDAAAQYGFPDFDTLNNHLETVTGHWSAGTPLTNTDKAALVFACGVAARQVYSAAGSGTFGVDQAFDAYVRFGYGCRLLTDADPDLYTALSANMRLARPAHLAVVDPAWSMGHNLVVDGWNSDDYFHLNFGWGGAYNGWYLLPQEIPYGLTVVEGAIVDIFPAVTAVGDDVPVAGSAGALGAAPNPFNPRTALSFVLPVTGQVRLAVFDAAGRLVRVLVNGQLPAGPCSVVWDGRDRAGREVGSGGYLARLEHGGGGGVVKLQVVR
ncbi:MAG: C10 family peptidase [bacterium]|nr:C10 family peptidase [bacterium]